MRDGVLTKRLFSMTFSSRDWTISTRGEPFAEQGSRRVPAAALLSKLECP